MNNTGRTANVRHLWTLLLVVCNGPYTVWPTFRLVRLSTPVEPVGTAHLNLLVLGVDARLTDEYLKSEQTSLVSNAAWAQNASS